MFQNIGPEQEIDARGHVNASTLAHPSANELRQAADDPTKPLITAVATGDADAMRVLLQRHNVRIILFVRLISVRRKTSSARFSPTSGRPEQQIEGRSQAPTWILWIARFEALSERGRRYDAELDEAVALKGRTDAGRGLRRSHQPGRHGRQHATAQFVLMGPIGLPDGRTEDRPRLQCRVLVG
jgi:hypothetical protein